MASAQTKFIPAEVNEQVPPLRFAKARRLLRASRDDGGFCECPDSQGKLPFAAKRRWPLFDWLPVRGIMVE